MSTITSKKVRGGMGALPYESGVAFRVWAPHADAVFVTGSFNKWSPDAHPMTLEGEGYWYADIQGRSIFAKIGARFSSACPPLGYALVQT